ncbi:PhzF family phenazine biosynthesis protein [Modicisalibacter coralii]|uniref:PhzF family phenazine biosynthesis protein n=1 Tax=Modicisalibacter coralii TaxID=2304602 RepID=UPI00100B3396|nr:PhzF family phenazine biosynthesis protein [Halomonas coralii]
MSRRHADYVLLDVFTTRRYAGNPLAVFVDADVTEKEMASIANELNLSETVFVSRGDRPGHFALRIFTPTMELPFAGHPTVGAAFLLDALGLAVDGSLHLDVPAGALAIAVVEGRPSVTTPPPMSPVSGRLSRRDAARLLGLATHQVIGEPVLASCGLPFHLIELDSRQSLTRACPSPEEWSRAIAPSGEQAIYCHVIEETDTEGGRVCSRMISMEDSLREDPATGSAAAALASHLAGQREGHGEWSWQIDQGVEMGRPSRIHARARRTAGGGLTVHIAGDAVRVGEGRLYL